jgi:hypothetical protein
MGDGNDEGVQIIVWSDDGGQPKAKGLSKNK